MIKFKCNFSFGLIIFLLLCSISSSSREDLRKVESLLQRWSKELGIKLYQLSTTMTRKEHLTTSFQPLEKNIYSENGARILNHIARDIRELMDKKVDAVKNIAEYAEFLAYHRDQITDSAKNYQFFNAENITNTNSNKTTKVELERYANRKKCDWWCQQNQLEDLKDNIYTKDRIDEDLFKVNKREFKRYCDCSTNNNEKNDKPIDYYNNLPLVYHKKFGTEVNLNISVVKVAANVYHRDPKVLEGIQWSESLDVVFKENYFQDKTLVYQYFASPLGYMRHFPAVKWSTEDYDKTYDPRTRSWFTEAITSPKDVIVLLDRSGSMTGYKRATATLIVNNILDTLNDNDFVNVYTFTNSSDPLVSCFENTLVQANEENLRLLRENLYTYRNSFTANVTAGVDKAFEILQQSHNGGSRCNKVIMIVSEEVDYDYHPKNFIRLNGKGNFPVRIFAYEIRTEEYKFAFQTDPGAMKWMACANRGYYVNITFKSEVREDVLIYNNVLSRPINDNFFKAKHKEPIWSYLQIDLADRRYSNWLWKKFEGNRQRAIFLDHIKRQYVRLGQILTSDSHMLLQESHEYERYKGHKEYDYMTTVSMPVFGRRQSDSELIGVAAVDVPIKLLNSKVNHYKLGVNGYAFILTNNGYVLMHPNHRREFKNIPKPTFNRVDFVEVEIMDDLTEPRTFNDNTIVQLRDDIVKRDKTTPSHTLKVKYTVDNMKRILHGKRTYFYTEIGPFNLGVALPDKYGLMVVKHPRINNNDFNTFKKSLQHTSNWEVHPDWVYCKEIHENKGRNPKEVVLNCLESPQWKQKSSDLFHTLLFDGNVTEWFETPNSDQHQCAGNFNVSSIFLATHSGLTRWYNFPNAQNLFEQDTHFKALDEDWYRRTVEENFSNEEEDNFIYSAPFEISGYEENLITSTNAIFLNNGSSRTPVAVVGLQFDRMALLKLYEDVIKDCGDIKCDDINCLTLDCFILDNNAYVVIADSAETGDEFDIEFTGRFFGDLRPDIMYDLVNDGVFKATKMFDYQAICYNPQQEPSSAFTFTTFLNQIIPNLFAVITSILSTISVMVHSVLSKPDYMSKRKDTLTFQNLSLEKTYPTPCDHQMTLFTLNDRFESSRFTDKTSRNDCEWQYVVQRIPNSNLLFMALNRGCVEDTPKQYQQSPTPIEIYYEQELPCHISKKNNFIRRSYINCFNRSSEEDTLYQVEGSHCGSIRP